MKRLSFLFLLLIFARGIFAQMFNIEGKVTDEKGIPLLGANVILTGTNFGAATDVRGYFKIEKVPAGKYRLKVSSIGYQKIVRAVELKKRDMVLNFRLKRISVNFDPVVVTASKYSQKLSELPVSAFALTPLIFSEKNFISLDQALRYVPGVYVIMDQVSIRGSSGYSRGAGSRVLTAIDGIPIYTGDTGEIIWQLVPLTDIEQVEIIKGASSSVYGSSSMGGVINVITKKASPSPVNLIKAYAGVYDKPYYSEWDWSKEYRPFNGITFARSDKIGKLGYTFSLTRREDESYRQNDWSKRLSGFLKLSYEAEKLGDFTFIATALNQHRGTFNFWKDSRHALVPPDDDQGEIVRSQRYLFGMKYLASPWHGFKFRLISSFYRSLWDDQSESANNSSSNLLRNEIQTVYRNGENLKMIAGVEMSLGRVKSNIFGNPTSQNVGVYVQTEYKFFSSLTFTAGVRYDNSRLDTLKSFDSFSPKLGLNYKVTKTFTLRTSVGKGFRTPTLAEAFTTTNTSGITVKANPHLKPETNYSFEIGMRKNFADVFSLDASLFQNEFYDMIEPGVDPHDGKVFFDNLTRARIQGVELAGEFVYKPFNLSMKFSYDYLWARNINDNKPLKYRPRHLADISVEYKPSFFEVGADLRYMSRFEEIDHALIDLGFVKDGELRSEVFVLDVRTGVSLFRFGVPLSAYLNLNNALNYNYVEMIGNVSPIRNISLNLEFFF